jgi:hypothetical protein
MKSRIILTAALTVLGLSQAEAQTQTFSESHTMNLSAQVDAYCTLGTTASRSLGDSYFISSGANASTIKVPVNGQGRAETITAELNLEGAVCSSPMHFAITGTSLKKEGPPSQISGFAEWIPYTFKLFVDSETPLKTISVNGVDSPLTTADYLEPLSGDIRLQFASTPLEDPLIAGQYTGTITIAMTAP